MQIVQMYFTDAMYILWKFLLPFGLSSLAITIAAASLASASLVESAHASFTSDISSKFKAFAHAGPVMITPVVVCHVLTSLSADTMGMGSLENLYILAFMGYIFHVGIEWFILENVFEWSTHLKRAKQVAFCSEPLNLRVISVVFFFECAWPLLFVFVTSMIFQHAMISGPYFMADNCSTLTSYLIGKISIDMSAGLRLVLVAVVLLTLGTPLLLVRGFYSIASKLITRCANSAYTPQSKLATSISIGVAYSRIIPIVIRLIAYLSTMVCLLTTVMVLVYLIDKSSSQIAMAGIATVLSSLLSPGVQSAIMGVLLAVIFFLVVVNGQGIHGYFRRKLILPESTTHWTSFLALVPPSIVATIALNFVIGPISQSIWGYIALIGYAVVLVFLFFPPSLLRDQINLIGNSNAVGLSNKRRYTIRTASRLPEILRPATIIVYFVWLEDSIQPKILESSNSFAKQVRGMKMSEINNSTYLGVLTCFVLFMVALAFIVFVVNHRFFLLRRLLGEKK